MELSNPVLSGLIRKRQELADELEDAQAVLRRVVASLDAMDATIRLFSPDLDLETARVRPARQVANPQQETTRHVLGILRNAEEPLTYGEIALRMMQLLGVTVTDRALVEIMRRRVGTCVRRLVGRRVVAESGVKDAVACWALTAK
ncbi:MAG: hypothetical protein ACRYG6_13615 [Janthinobacterium lividum]